MLSEHKQIQKIKLLSFPGESKFIDRLQVNFTKQSKQINMIADTIIRLLPILNKHIEKSRSQNFITIFKHHENITANHKFIEYLLTHFLDWRGLH